MNKSPLIAAVVALTLSATAESAIVYTANQITQITDVAVTAVNADWGSTGSGDPRTVHFNVDFVYGTYGEVFGSGAALPAGWPFDTRDLATAATYGLGDALRAEGALGTDVFAGGQGEPWIPFYVGEVPSGTNYCSLCVQVRGVDYWVWTGSSPSWGPNVVTPNIQLTQQITWAVFTEVTAVPVPAAGWLLGSGLMLLFAAARRKRP